MEKKEKSDAKKWKTPDEIIRLHRLKQKQKALQARLDGPAKNNPKKSSNITTEPTNVAKRRNPFVQDTNKDSKRQKIISEEIDFGREDTVFQLLANPKTPPQLKSSNATKTIEKAITFADYLSQTRDEEEIKFEKPKPSDCAPIDWSLKTKLRILSNTVLPGNCLKTSQEASGITSFVRCLDPNTTSTGLDISPGARFHQSTLYWQHPNLPWLTLFPRNNKSNNNFILGDVERTALTREWTESFRALFQLLRARQCPYFYVCANSFTVLFRAAGIGGRVETHAMLTPTSRGMRAALKQEEIEFTMPLRNAQNKSFDSGTDVQNSSFSNSTDEATHDSGVATFAATDDDGGDDDDEDQEQWLASLGVDDSEIKKLNSIQSRIVRNAECEEDFSDQSVVLVEGIECQAFFNFLLNSKSTTAKVGKLAGIPPTLLSPVSFPGATLRNLQMRHSKVRMNNTDYQSMELHGVILPHILPYLCMLLKESKETFSASMTSQLNTISFSKAAQKLIEDLNKENNETTSDHVFGRENLSDCGLLPQILESFCRVSTEAVRNLERICYNKEIDGFLWSEL